MNITRHPLKSAPLTIAAMPWPPRRAIPGRDTCTGGCETRGGCDCVRGFPHTVPTDYGSADALGDDQALRHSAWGAIDECAAPEGGRHREPSRTMRDAPGLLASLLWPLGVVGAIAAAAVWLR